MGEDDRAKQIQRDEYYLRLAQAVESGADCLGTKVGAVIALRNRVVSTGYNGTPEGFVNCKDHGCVRCHDRWLEKQARVEEMSDPSHTAGRALDKCICVHAEQNAFLSAARFGIALEGATLYTTQSPCFSCLKEAVQAGINRIVYGAWYHAEYSAALAAQYQALYEHLTEGDPTRFEALGGGRPHIEDEGQPDPYVDSADAVVRLEPPGAN